MPILLRNRTRARVSTLQEHITRMTMAELIRYEATLWQWMNRLDKSKMHSENIVVQLNAIHREVEWRAGEKEWQDAAHS
jgi:hypothetical protein